MRLGICTRYRHDEATQVALRIADWAARRCIDVTLFSETTNPRRLGCPWDREVQATAALRFTDWAVKCSTVIWTHVPIPEQVAWVKQRSICTAIVALWTEAGPDDVRALQEANLVIAPSACASAYFAGLKLKGVITLPWDVGLPFTQKDARISTRRKWVLLPLFDRETHVMEATVIEVAGRMLKDCKDTVLTVAYQSSTLAPFAKRRIQDFQRYFGERVRVVRSPPLHLRPLLFQGHDLTLWPVHAASTGMTALMSMNMGTPVLAYHFPPASEFLNQQNSVHVGVEVYFDGVGAPRMEPDYAKFEEGLRHQLGTEGLLQEFQQNVLQGLPQRRTVFSEVLSQVVH